MYCKILTIFVVLIGWITSPVSAGELNSFESKPVQDAQLQYTTGDAEAVKIGIPVYPSATEVSADILEQGSFAVRNQVFKIEQAYQKVFNFYEKALGREAEITYTKNAYGNPMAHFYLVNGSKSSNVIVEEISKERSRVTFTIFEGGGGSPLAA